MQKTDEAVQSSEREQVERWRRHELLDAGCSRYTANRLAASHEDLHAMVKAKLAGCSDDLLVDIFADGTT